MSTGSQDLVRCPWVNSDQIYIDYHDNEWGKELTGQRNLFEKDDPRRLSGGSELANNPEAKRGLSGSF